MSYQYTNPICIVLLPQFEAALVTLGKAKEFQRLVVAQAKAIEDVTHLWGQVELIPDIPITFDAGQINNILNSCPGTFGNINDINLNLTKGMNDFIKNNKGNPLGIISALNKGLNTKMKKMEELMNNAFGWLTCMKNLCGLEQAIYDSYLSSLNTAKSDLGILNGKSTAMGSNIGYCVTSYNTKMGTIKNNAKKLSKITL